MGRKLSRVWALTMEIKSHRSKGDEMDWIGSEAGRAWMMKAPKGGADRPD